MTLGIGELVYMERGKGKTTQMIAEILAEQQALSSSGDSEHRIMVSVLHKSEAARVLRLLREAGAELYNIKFVTHKELQGALRGVSATSVYIDEFTEIPRDSHEALDRAIEAGRIGVKGWYS